MRLSTFSVAFAAALAGTAFAGSPAQHHQEQPTAEVFLFAGTFTRDEGWINGTGDGIYSFKFNTVDGSLTPLAVTSAGTNPSYVRGSTKTFSRGKPTLYATHAVRANSTDNPGTQTGYVSALTVNSNGSLELLNTLETQGGLPLHVSLSPNEDFAIVSNFDGTLTMFPLNADGSLANATYHEAFPIGSNVTVGQTSGHTHSSMWLPKSNHMVVADLGSDKLLQYELNPAEETLMSLGAVRRPPGSGPRHMAQHPNGKFAYVVDEIGNSVGVYHIDQSRELLTGPAVQNLSFFPSTGADIHLSSNGRFLYTSNRGHNSISLFQVSEVDGTLTSLGWESTMGGRPWGFTVYGDWLIVGNNDTNNMHVFKVDPDSGLLAYSGNSYEVGTVTCLHVAEYYM